MGFSAVRSSTSNPKCRAAGSKNVNRLKTANETSICNPHVQYGALLLMIPVQQNVFSHFMLQFCTIFVMEKGASEFLMVPSAISI